MYINYRRGTDAIHSITSEMPDQVIYDSINYPDNLPLPVMDIRVHKRVSVCNKDNKPLFVNFEGIETTDEYHTIPYAGQKIQGAIKEWEGEKEVLKIPNEAITRSESEDTVQEVKAGLVVPKNKIQEYKYKGLLTVYQLTNEWTDCVSERDVVNTDYGQPALYPEWRDLHAIFDFNFHAEKESSNAIVYGSHVGLRGKDSYVEFDLNFDIMRENTCYKVHADITRNGKPYTCEIQVRVNGSPKEVVDGEPYKLPEDANTMVVRFTNLFDEAVTLHSVHVVMGNNTFTPQPVVSRMERHILRGFLKKAENSYLNASTVLDKYTASKKITKLIEAINKE